MSKNPLPAAIYIFVIFVTTRTIIFFFIQIYVVNKVHFKTELEAEDDFELEDV